MPASRKNRPILIRLLLLAAFGFSLLAYQNCNRKSQTDTSASNNGGNNTGYDGNYFHVFESTCADGTNIEGVIVYVNGNAQLLKDECHENMGFVAVLPQLSLNDGQPALVLHNKI